MSDDARNKIIELDKRRNHLRSTLTEDVKQAKYDLHPKTVARRWTDRKHAQIRDIADSGKQSLKKNAPLIGVASAVILLFAARKPISNAISHMRNTMRKSKDQKP